MKMIEQIKAWYEKKQQERRLINKGKLMYHKGYRINDNEDILVQKGYYDAEREELRSIERLKRQKELNQKMKINNGRKVSIGKDPFTTPKSKKKHPIKYDDGRFDIKW